MLNLRRIEPNTCSCKYRCFLNKTKTRFSSRRQQEREEEEASNESTNKKNTHTLTTKKQH